VTDAPQDPVPFPITPELDLHTFRPQDLGDLLPAYFEACRARGIGTVRIIHGKGSGTLQATVHHHLRCSPHVIAFRLGNETSGGWGATLVRLRPAAPPAEP